jgi:hypothetical protein
VCAGACGCAAPDGAAGRARRHRGGSRARCDGAPARYAHTQAQARSTHAAHKHRHERRARAAHKHTRTPARNSCRRTDTRAFPRPHTCARNRPPAAHVVSSAGVGGSASSPAVAAASALGIVRVILALLSADAAAMAAATGCGGAVRLVSSCSVPAGSVRRGADLRAALFASRRSCPRAPRPSRMFRVLTALSHS